MMSGESPTRRVDAPTPEYGSTDPIKGFRFTPAAGRLSRLWKVVWPWLGVVAFLAVTAGQAAQLLLTIFHK